MTTTKLKLKAIGLSFVDGVIPSLIIIVLFALVYLFYPNTSRIPLPQI